MEPEDYPALFRAADAASRRAQDAHLRSIRGFAALSIGGAGLAAHGIASRESAFAAALLFAGSLMLSLFMAVRKHEGTWYRGRALAESIKTSTWKMMMRAEPFGGSDVRVVRADFQNLLLRVVGVHEKLAQALARTAGDQDPLTAKMLAVRDLSLAERRDFYRTRRIEEQRTWYAKKAAANERGWRVWFGVLIACQAGAITFTLPRVVEPSWQYWPAEILVIAGASALSWTQTRRFQEISAAYALAAREIDLARHELDEVPEDEQSFSRFVSNTENAFSREHTQWAARRE